MSAESSEPRRERQPWWSTEDPAGHRDDGAGTSHGDHVRPSWMDAMEALDGVVRAATKGARDAADRVTDARDGLAGHVDGVDDGRGDGAGGGSGSGGPPRDHRHGAVDAYCHVCPICALLRALEDVRPEVLVHLTEAARHVTLAAKAVVDAQAERAGGDDGFESIPVDD